VLKGSLAVVAAGMVLGALGSIAAGRLLSGLLFGVAPHDPAVIGGALLLLGMAALAASCLPAARAARLDPMATLRAE